MGVAERAPRCSKRAFLSLNQHSFRGNHGTVSISCFHPCNLDNVDGSGGSFGIRVRSFPATDTTSRPYLSARTKPHNVGTRHVGSIPAKSQFIGYPTSRHTFFGAPTTLKITGSLLWAGTSSSTNFAQPLWYTNEGNPESFRYLGGFQATVARLSWNKGTENVRNKGAIVQAVAFDHHRNWVFMLILPIHARLAIYYLRTAALYSHL